MKKILYRHRGNELLSEEKVPSELAIRLLYSSFFTRPLLKLVVTRFLSSYYGRLMSSRKSCQKIARFIEDYAIDINESLKGLDEFTSFNDFFTRKLKQTARPINCSASNIVSPADGKILVYQNVNDSPYFCIKGDQYTFRSLLNDDTLAERYMNCSLAIIRLAPTDYHRFHFPLAGKVSATREVTGKYYSVSPIALRSIPSIFTLNKRTICEIMCTDTGSYLYLEIGATMVGSIVQTYTADSLINKGDEKGYFEFGGSTVIVAFPQGSVRFDSDLLENTLAGYETKVQMGERIAEIEL